jgi:uncharacterized membrane protein
MRLANKQQLDGLIQLLLAMAGGALVAHGAAQSKHWQESLGVFFAVMAVVWMYSERMSQPKVEEKK